MLATHVIMAHHDAFRVARCARLRTKFKIHCMECIDTWQVDGR